MEYVDILDKNGNKNNVIKLKDDAHRDGDWHKAAHIWIMNSNGELLIQKRSPNKVSHPNLWDISAAGHISAGEDEIDAALREVEEELSLSLKRTDLEFLFTYKQQAVLNNGTFINNEFDDVYLVSLDNINLSEFKLQEDEVSKVKFIDYKELKRIADQNDKEFVPHKEEYERLFHELRKRFD